MADDKMPNLPAIIYPELAKPIENNVIGMVHPYRPEYRVSGTVPPGYSIEEAIASALHSCHMRMAFLRHGIAQVGTMDASGKTVSWRFVPREKWAETKLGPRDILRFRLLEKGGGGGGGKGGGVLGIVLTAVVAVVAVVTSALTFGALTPVWGALGATVAAGLAGMAVSTIGTALINSIAPVNAPGLSSGTSLSDQTLKKADSSYSLSAGKNQLNQWGRVPVPVGQGRYAPPKCAADYTSVKGDDQYLHLLFCLGIGDMMFSNIKIGTSLLSNFKDVDYEIYTYDPNNPRPPKYYPVGAIEEPLNIELKYNEINIRTTAECDYAEVDFALNGCCWIDDLQGLQWNREIFFDVRWKATEENEWLDQGETYNINGVQNWKPTSADYIVVNAVVGVSIKKGVFFRVDETEVGADEIKLGTCMVYHQTNILYQGENAWGEHFSYKIHQYHYAYTANIVVPDGLKISGFEVRANSSTTFAEAGISVSGGTITEVGYAGSIPRYRIAGNQKELLRRTLRINFPRRGRYQISIRRRSTKHDKGYDFSDSYWLGLRSFKYGNPVKTKYPVMLLSMRIKASAQLNGTVETLTLFYQTKCWDYDLATNKWVWRYTSNPASIFRYILQQKHAFARPVPDSQLDFESIIDAWKAWNGKGWTYDKVMDGNISIYDRLCSICAAGLGSPTMVEAKWGIIVDKIRTNVACAFTAANAWQWKFQKTQIRLPNAIHCNFINRQTWDNDQRIVPTDEPQDGEYIYETQTYDGVTNPAQVWQLARFHYADAKRRRRTISFRAYDEAILAKRGDLVDLACPSINPTGLQVGRVRRIRLNSDGAVIGFTTDQINITSDGKDGRRFGVKIYSDSGDIYHAEVEPHNVQEREITFVTAQFMDIQNGNKYAFGDWNEEVIPAIVLSMEFNADWTCDITCQDYDPLLYGNVNGYIPEFESIITRPIEAKWSIYSIPIIVNIETDDRVLVMLDGAKQPAMLISYTHPADLDPKAAFVSVEIKASTEEEWRIVDRAIPISQLECYVYNVSDKTGYDIRMRYLGKAGEAGPYVQRKGVFISGNLLPPNPISALWITGDIVYWEHEGKTADVIGYQVFMTMDAEDDFAHAKQLHDGYITDMQFNIAKWRDHARGVWVRAVSSNGLYSEPRVIYIDLGYIPEDNIIGIMYESCTQGRCWPGQIIEGYLRDDAVHSVTYSPKYIADELPWNAEIMAFPDPEGSSFVYETDVFIPDGMGVCNFRIWPTFIRGGLRMIEFTKLEFNMPYNVGELTWEPGVCPFRLVRAFDYKPFETYIEVRQHEEYRFRITSVDGILTIMPEITFVFDVPDAEPYHIEDYRVFTEERLPVPERYFRSIRDVKFTLQWVAGDTGVSVLCVDKGIQFNGYIIDGPMIRVIDADRQITSGVIDATIYGVQYTGGEGVVLNTPRNKSKEIARYLDDARDSLSDFSALLNRILDLETAVQILQEENINLKAMIPEPDGKTIVMRNGKFSAFPSTYNRRLVIDESGTFTAPVGAYYEVTVIGGGDGAYVAAGNLSSIQNGASGAVKREFIELAKGQTVQVSIGAGGQGIIADNDAIDVDFSVLSGGDTTFGELSSAGGPRFGNAYLDLFRQEDAALEVALSGAGLGGSFTGIHDEDLTALDGAWFGSGGSAHKKLDADSEAALILKAGNGHDGATILRFYDPAYNTAALLPEIGDGPTIDEVELASILKRLDFLESQNKEQAQSIVALQKKVVIATTERLGIVQPDGETIEITPEGVISAVGGSNVDIPDDIMERIQTLESDAANTRINMNDANNRIQINTSAIASLRLDVNTLTNQQAAFQTEINNLWADQEDQDNRIAALLGQLNDIASQIGNVVNEVNGMNTRLANAEATLGNLSVDFEELRELVESSGDLLGGIAEYENRIKQLETEAYRPRNYNRRLVIEESGIFVAPASGYYNVTCIGGGDGALCQTVHEKRLVSQAGASGAVRNDLVHLEKGQEVNVVIGAGGQGIIADNWIREFDSLKGTDTTFGEITSAGGPRFGTNYFNLEVVASAVLFATGAGLGSGFRGNIQQDRDDWNTMPTPDGQWYGAGGSSLASYRVATNQHENSTAGNGHDGAVILLFYDPEFDGSVDVPDASMAEEMATLKLHISALNQKVNKIKVYEIGWLYWVFQVTPPDGFEIPDGHIITNASEKYPDAWAHFQTVEGQKMCITEAQWQEMSTKGYYTLADGTQIGFNGVGGVPYFVLDVDANTIRLPDIRETYPTPAGAGGITFGAVDIDRQRQIYGNFGMDAFVTNKNGIVHSPNYVFYEYTATGARVVSYTASGTLVENPKRIGLDTARLIPTGGANTPKRFGMWFLVYMGKTTDDQLDSVLDSSLIDRILNLEEKSENFEGMLDLVAEEAKRPKLYNTEEIITESGTWTAPVDGDYEVTVIGGGDGAIATTGFDAGTQIQGGASGTVRNALIKLEKGQEVNVVIGAGGQGVIATSWNEAQFLPAKGTDTTFGELTSAGGPRFGGNYFHINATSSTINISGAGLGSGFRGNLFNGISNNNQIATPDGQWYGAGGSAANSYNSVGSDFSYMRKAGNGAPGAVIVRYHDPDKEPPLELPDGGGINSVVARIEKLEEQVDDPWQTFPIGVPVAVEDVSFVDRHPVFAGETEPRENWFICDGGDNGNGGTVPNLLNRFIMGFDGTTAAAYGGAASHVHAITASAGNTTLELATVPSHNHMGSYTTSWVTKTSQYYVSQNTSRSDLDSFRIIAYQGSSGAHSHSVSASADNVSNLPPYFTMAYVIRVE